MLRPMTALRKTQMTVDEFLSWSEGQEGRWELIDGEILKLEAERAAHARVKFAASIALREAVHRAKAPCEVFPGGMTVRIAQGTAYRPDVLVQCGPRVPGKALEVGDPVIVVEVLSPGTAARDYGDKVDGYFSVASVQHYLILAPEERKIVHHWRGQGDAIERRLITSGPI